MKGIINILKKVAVLVVIAVVITYLILMLTK